MSKWWVLHLGLLWMLSFSLPVFAQEGLVKDGYWFSGGRMMRLRNGQVIQLTRQEVLPNGIAVLPNGALITRDGVRRNLAEGQAIDAAGRILFPQTQKNGSVILVPRHDYLSGRDPGRQLKQLHRAGRPHSQANGFQARPAPGKFKPKHRK